MCSCYSVAQLKHIEKSENKYKNSSEPLIETKDAIYERIINLKKDCFEQNGLSYFHHDFKCCIHTNSYTLENGDSDTYALKCVALAVFVLCF